MVLDCTLPVHSHRFRQWLRSPRRTAFSLRRCRWPDFKLQIAHYTLIDQFFSAVEMSPYLLDLALKVPAMSVLDAVEWFEAWEGDRLAGISAVIDAFCDMDLALFLTADRATPGASDFLYGSMRNTVLERGKRFLNLGPSPSDGHYRFNAKWGAQPQTPPDRWQAWGVGELVRRQYDSWPSRLLQYGFFFPLP